jgi:hypothetical protein
MLKPKFKFSRILLAVSFAFFPSLALASPASANCVYPGQEAAAAAVQQNASNEPVVVELVTCGGDDTSYQVPLSVDVTFDGVTYSNVYATTNSVITFGAPDGTYWTYPSTPSISLYSFDWVVYPGQRADEHLIIRSSDGGFQVDISARPIWLQNATEPTKIVITAAILSDGSVAMAYILSGPEYPEYSPRTGVRLNDGTIVNFETYGIEETEETPELAPEPTEEAPFNPPPPPPSLNEPTNVVATQLKDGTVQLTWDTPNPTSTSVERYAVSWSTDSFNTAWAVASTTNSIILSREVFASTGGLDTDYQFRIRSDNDTEGVYSQYSTVSSSFVASPQPTPPVTPEGSVTVNEGSSFEVVAPEGKRVANVSGYYGDPNDSTQGDDVSSILFDLISGETSVTVEVTNEVFGNDPAPGTPKVLILLIVYEDIPVEPTPAPSPSENPTPTPNPAPVEPVAPVVPPTTPVVPEPEPSLEPKPEVTPTPQPQEPVRPAPPTTEPVVPFPELPSKNPITSVEDFPEEITPELLMQVDLTKIVATDLSVAQVEVLVEAALETFETAEQGSPEYEQALDALFVAAQADDIVLDETLAVIPLLGNALEGALELVNFLGNAGADMSPQVREQSEKTIIAAVIVTQIALSTVSMAGIATTVNLRSGA